MKNTLKKTIDFSILTIGLAVNSYTIIQVLIRWINFGKQYQTNEFLVLSPFQNLITMVFGICVIMLFALNYIVLDKMSDIFEKRWNYKVEMIINGIKLSALTLFMIKNSMDFAFYNETIQYLSGVQVAELSPYLAILMFNIMFSLLLMCFSLSEIFACLKMRKILKLKKNLEQIQNDF